MEITDLDQKNGSFYGIFTKAYWREAAAQIHDTRMITIAALFVALRIVVKFLNITIPNTSLVISFDAYVNSIGSTIYGPVMGLGVGVISDALGEIVRGRISEFFFPFSMVEMASSFLFGLFFWRRRINTTRALCAKFTVNVICNMFLTTLCLWWMYDFYGMEKSKLLLPVDTTVRIVKNLMMFPLQSMLIVITMASAIPMLTRMHVIDAHYCWVEKPSNKKYALKVAAFTVLSLLLVVFYVLYLDDLVTSIAFNV